MEVFYIKRGDTSPALEVTFDPPVGLVGASVVFIAAATAFTGGPVSIERQPCVIVDADQGIVRYDWTSADTAVANSNVRAEFEVTFADGSVETYPNGGYLRVAIVEDLG